MSQLLLDSDPSFDPSTQAVVGCLTAGLDDQLRRLKESVADLGVEALEWQSAPGMNTVGMLLAHLALVEVWWIDCAPRGTQQWSEGEGRFRDVLGLGAAADGIPLATDGGHPDALRGKSAADYIALLDAARVCVHDVLRSWTDATLDETITDRRRTLSKRWILYHVLEHFAAHFGQVLLIRHQLGDAGFASRLDD